MKVFKLVFIGLLFILPLSGMAQYDYEHYVPPFYCSAQVGKQELFLSTNSEKDLKVFIEDGQGNTVAGPFTINRNQSKTYVFKTPGGDTYSSHNSSTYPDGCSYSYGIIGPKELNKPLNGQGLRIYSYDGPFFANIRHGFSNGGEYGALTHGGSLSAKGAYAKGKDFYSGHLYSHTINYSDPSYSGGYPIRSHFISVMAVEDGQTTVNFSGIKCKYITKYDGANVVLESIDPSDVITGTLSKGQSYVIGVNLHASQFSGETAMVRNGMNGTHITSTQKIVVNCGSWTAGAKPSQDIGFDQIVPVDQVRDKYIVMKGEGKAEPDPTAYYAGQERTIVVATQANTEVWVNGNNKGTLANAGDFIILDDIVNPKALPTLYIDTKGKDVYVYQTMCGTNQDWTNIGLNFIPPLTGLGIKEVVIPQANYITTGAGGLINPTVTVLAQKNVDVQRNGTSLSNPQNVPGTTEWVYYKVPNISGDCRFTGSKAINVAWTASSNTLGAAGYYSGFTKAVSPIHPVLNIDKELSLVCESYDENISVALVEPFPDFYEWYVNDFTGNPIIENGPLVVPAPDVETIYYVLGYYRDPSLDILFNGDFSDGFNGFESDYDIVTSNLVDPGNFALASTPVAENPVLADFGAMDGGRMFLGYSDRQGEVVYQVNELPVEENFSYIFKLHGRLAKNNSTYNQSLKVLINDETIIEDFKIDKSTEWQSVSALWKPGTVRKATIKILNHNLDNQDTFFALDSISFVQAVQDTAKFTAKVVPNFSYGSDGDIVHFCKGVSNSLDVSNGDISWYDYSWSKGGVDLIDGAEFSGVKSPELIFASPQESQEGEYICTIGFKPEYQDCGTSGATVDVTLNVLVDEEATVSIDTDKTSFCSGSSTTLNALVTGDAGDVKWYVDGGTSPVSLENPYTFNYSTGTYTVRCEVENGCGVAADQVVINVLSTPVLNSITSNDDLCVGQDIILTALATGDGVLTYDWKRGSQTLSETGSVLNYTASMLDRDATFKVKVTSVYTIAGETVECPNSLGMAVFDLDIYPLVEFDKLLQDATVCEGNNHSFSVDMKYPGDFYTYSWNKDGVDLLNNLSSLNLSSVKNADAGNYRVDVTNRCNSGFSAADLIVTPKIKVNGFSLDKTGPFCSASNVTASFNVDNNGAVYIYQVKEPDGTIKNITNPYTFTVDASHQGIWEFFVSSSCDAPVSFQRTLNMFSDFGTLSVADVGTCIGENVTFEAKVSTIPTATVLHYAWTDNDGNPIGTDSDKLELLNVQDAAFGNYSVLVTDQCGNTKTANANLTKEAVTSPATATSTVCVGDNFSTTVTYLGSPISFEWRFGDKDSGPIVGTTETLSLTNVTLAQAGVYYCKVALSCGTAVIQRELIVNTHVSLVDSTDKIINICEGAKPLLSLLTTEINGNPADYSIVWKNFTGTNIGTGTSIQLDAHNIVGSFIYTATVVGKCETPIKTYRVIVHAKPLISSLANTLAECSGSVSLDVSASGEHNGIVWWKDGSVITDGNADPTNFVLNPATSPSDDGAYVAKVESDYCGDAQVTINLDIRNTIVVTAQSPAITVVCENDATNLFVTATGDNIVYNWYKSADLTKTTISDKSNLDLGNITLAKAGEYTCELTNDLNCGNQTLTFDVQVQENATVTNPTNVVMCEDDGNPEFSVVGTGEAPVTYQWYDKNNAAVAGATSNSLTVTTPVNGQSYYCVVSGSACGTATSNKASLTIIKNVAVTNPLDRTISDGANVSFSVVASGEPSYTYKWYENSGSGWILLSNGGKYSGVNLPTLQITGADKATFDGNQYRCEVISSGAICASSATSNPATLTVTEVTKIAVQAVSTTVCFNDNATLSVEGASTGLTYTWYYKKGAGAYETAYGKDGITISEVGQVSTLTILADDLDINNWTFKCLVSDGVSTDQYSNEVVVTVLEDIAVTTADASYNPCVGQAFSMSVSATGDGIKYKWYKVGAESTILSTSASYNMGTISLAKAGTYKCEVYNDLACNDDERSFVVNVKALPTTTNPADVTMCVTDADPDFKVVPGGDGPFTYQWYDNSGVIGGAINDSYTETSPVNGKYYYCEVTNSCKTVASGKANLIVVEELTVTNPSNLTIADGANAEFSVIASGEPTYSYAWEEYNGSTWNSLSNAGKYSGTDTYKLKITGADQASFDGNKYRCIVNTSGTVCIPSVTSGEAILTVNLVDKIFIQPNNDRVCLNDFANVNIEGKIAGLTYDWEFYNGSVWADVATNSDFVVVTDSPNKVSTLTIHATNLVMSTWIFRCSVNTSPATTVQVSSPATIEVLDNIVVTPGLLNFSLCEKEALSMSVSATGGDIKYKWYKDTDATTTLSVASSFSISEVLSTDAGAYTCEVYNDINCNNQVVNFNVGVNLHSTITDPVDKEVCASETNIEFEVTATGDGPLTYQWYDSSNNPVAEATATSDKLVVGTPVDGQSYYCVVTNSCNTATSAVATLTVYEEVSIVNDPLDVTIPDGGNATFTVKVAGEPDYTYQWQVWNGATWDDLSDGVHYAGTQSKTLQVNNADQLTFNGKQYHCVAGNTKCSADATSNLATLTITSVAKIFGQPDNQEICLSGAVDFEITGKTLGLNYDWEYSTDGVVYTTVTGVSELNVVTDASGSKLEIATTTLAMNSWTFRCIVRDGVSADETSGVASLNVVEPVNFDAIADENLCFGAEKQISLANLSGTEPISFSWMKGAAEVSTTSTVSIGASDNGNYQVTAGNGGVCPDKIADFDVLHYSALSLNAWGNTDEICIGQTEVLTVGVASKDALLPVETYQWYKDGSPVVTSSGLTLVATDKNQTGQYKVEVSDACSTETVFGYVNVYEPISASNSWNAETTLCIGSELKLDTKVTGDVTSYVWTKDGVGFSANSTYVKPSVDAADAGTYVCTVSGNCGVDITYTIDVTVLEAPVITKGLDAIAEVCEGESLVLGPIVVSGTYNDPVWTLNDNVTQVTTTIDQLNLGTAELSEAGNYLVTVNNLCGSDASLGNQVINPILTLDPIAPQTVCAGNDVVFRANATGTSLNYQWLVDGVDQSVNSSELIIDASDVQPFDLNTSKTYNVECKITSTTGCGDDSQSTTLTVKPNTLLHATLKNVPKYVGESYTMTVDVTGVDLVFEWTHELTDGTKVPLAETGPSITLTNITMADAGYYTCKIIGTCGQRLASGKLTVKEPVTIVSGLNTLEEKCVGDPLSLSISATGQISSVKWFKNDILIPSETSLNLYFAALGLADAAVYKCEIEGEGISVITETTTVRVYSQTVLNTSLSDTTLCEGSVLDWVPDIDGTSSMTFEWTMDGVNVSDQKILHSDALALSDEGNYEIQITSMCGDVSSNANLEIIQLPVYVSSTVGKDVCENEPLVEFTVEYTGERLKYQWRKGGIDLPGKISETLSLTNIQLSDDGDYNCRVYSTCGEEFSPVATLNVTPQLKVLSDQVDMEVCAGEDVLFTADAVGNNVNYQWKVDGVDVVDVPGVINGANTSSLSIVSAQVSHSGYYTCILSDDCTDYRSTKPTELVVHALPNTAIYGRMVLCAKEDRVTYVLNQVNADVYSWNVDGGIFAGPEEGAKTRVTWEELSPGSLSVSIMDLATGCQSRVDSAVVLNSLPNVNLTSLGSKGVCEKEFVLSGGFPEGGIYWINGISQTEFNPSDRGAGTYAVHYSYTDGNGCSNVTPVTNLTVDVLPVVDITDDITVGSCIPTPLSAKTDEDNIQWFKIQDNNRVLPDNLDNPNSMNPTFTPGKSQVLLAMVKDEHGCEGIDLLNLSVAPLPVVTTINDTTVSQCNQLVLQTDIVGDQDVISWTNPDHLDHSDVRSPKIIDAPAGTHTYTINVTDLYGCDAAGEVTVTMLADPTLGEDKFGCEGDKYEIDITGMENPVWNDDDSSPVRTIDKPGEYRLEVSNEYGCGDEQLFVINPKPNLGLKDTLIFEGQTVTFSPNLPSYYAPYFFEWQDGSIFQRFEVSETGTYKLKVEDNLGCVAIDSAYVEVKPVGIESSNAFLPLAGDGTNDRFFVGDNENMGGNADERFSIIEEFEMYVYDRWGELLYKTNEQGYKGGWNGQYKGKLCPAGAYVWVVFINGELTNKGTFMLIR
ncbi:gliding motility-associated C-terminal domain-containing protein [Labilibaculum sp. K2S]|uniref:T9SS type B sorting domain-containing protein n=1 Tax=Labilibaculum sp. K2S TaxID=3056386 RepID=UPI0025A47BB3|nr:gliding motility-associated C-terminal domain-containing protein [Labilibaculum sp. K2S]MDM8161316.1 gliding motility-associated C-terminal domain-containing protein [Labilibaculum sp. K2S]